MTNKIILATVVLVAFATAAHAQQRTIYGSDGRVIGHQHTDSQGTVTTSRHHARDAQRHPVRRQDHIAGKLTPQHGKAP